jgi:peptidyl-prolyl cis-trans isomerase SurA
MRFWKKLGLLFFCTLFSAALPCGIVRSEVIDRIVATVNGEIILYSEVQQQLKIMERVAPDLKALDEQKKGQVERDVLNQLIRQRLTDAEVKRLKIIVSNTELDETVDQIIKENRTTRTQFENTLKQEGLTFEKFRDNVKKELERNHLLERILKMKTVITDQQVDAYLNANKPETLPAKVKVHLGLILLPVDPKGGDAKESEKTGQEIVGKLKGGGDFKSLAIQFSKGPSAAQGGDIGSLAPEELAPFIADAIKNLKEGDVSGLVRGPGGYYIIKMFGTDKQTASQVDPELREKVRRELFQKEVNRKFDEWVRDLESKAFIQNTL